MANLPEVDTTVDETAGASGAGLDQICVCSPVPENADMLPRYFGGSSAIYEKHGFSEGLGYCALHFARTKKNVVFVGLPIETPGEISREIVSGNTGTSSVAIAAGADGVLAEHDGVLSVIRGGTVGSSPSPILGLSLDGGRTTKRVRLGTNTTYAEPYYGFTLTFISGGTLVTGDTILTWHGSAPKASMADFATARVNLSADSKHFRTLLLCSEIDTSAECQAFVDELDAYDTENDRYIVGRASVFDHRQARMSQHRVAMTGTPEITFLEVGASGDTITRDTGSFVDDGFAANQVIRVRNASTPGNNITDALITDVTANVLTLDDADLENETATGIEIVGSFPVEFSSEGTGTETITRTDGGSFIADGFAVGGVADLVHAIGTFGGAEGEYTITNVAADVLTVADPDSNFNGGSYASYDADISSVELLTDWIARAEEEFDNIQGSPHISLSAGRGRITDPITKWFMRRPAAWAAALREFQHDLHIPTWRKSDGPIGFSIENAEGTPVEWDDRTGGKAASAAAFTCLRTWANDTGTPPFIGVDVTRASEDQMRSYTHNMHVCNLAQQLVQRGTENVAVGQSLVLNSDGTATKDSLRGIEAPVNTSLQNELLTNKKAEGQRASSVLCTVDPSTVYNTPEPTMVTNTEILLNGTVHSVTNRIRVNRG